MPLRLAVAVFLVTISNNGTETRPHGRCCLVSNCRKNVASSAVPREVRDLNLQCVQLLWYL